MTLARALTLSQIVLCKFVEVGFPWLDGLEN
jgi:hypothetical protein